MTWRGPNAISWHSCWTCSTTRSMYRTSLGMSSSITRRRESSCGTVSAAAVIRGTLSREGRKRERAPTSRHAAGSTPAHANRCSEALERSVACIGDLEKRIELRQLEQGLQVVVEIGQAQLSALLADFLGQRHQ